MCYSQVPLNIQYSEITVFTTGKPPPTLTTLAVSAAQYTWHLPADSVHTVAPQKVGTPVPLKKFAGAAEIVFYHEKDIVSRHFPWHFLAQTTIVRIY